MIRLTLTTKELSLSHLLCPPVLRPPCLLQRYFNALYRLWYGSFTEQTTILWSIKTPSFLSKTMAHQILLSNVRTLLSMMIGYQEDIENLPSGSHRVFNVICILSSVSAISLGLSDQVAGRNALLEHTSFYCKCKWLQDPASESSYWLPARSPRRQESFVVVVSISLELSSSGQWQSCRVRDKCRTKSTALQRKVSHDTILQRKAKKHKIGMLQVHWNCTDSDRRMASSTQKYHGSILLIFCWTLASARRSGGIVTDHLLSIKEFQQAIASPMCSNEDGSDP